MEVELQILHIQFEYFLRLVDAANESIFDEPGTSDVQLMITLFPPLLLQFDHYFIHQTMLGMLHVIVKAIL